MISCGGEPSKVKEPYNESREFVPNPEGYKKDTSIVKQGDSAVQKAKLKSKN